MVIRKHPEGFRRIRTVQEGLVLSTADYSGPVLNALGKVHRDQELAIFGSEGRANVGGWPALSPPYEAKKKKVTRRRMLNLSGETKARFTGARHLGYFQRFFPRGTGGVFQFGARSSVAAAHLYGKPELAAGIQSTLSRRIFGGTARRLPVRDMITKTAAMVAQLRHEFAVFYAKRVDQVLRHRR